MPQEPRERCVIFIDGSNFYHQLKAAGFRTPGRLDYARLAEKLVMEREWLETRFYIGEVQVGGGALRDDQRAFLENFRSHERHQVVLGTIQKHLEYNPLAAELLNYLADLRTPIDRSVYKNLVEMGKRQRRVETYKEKGVDVALACDMVRFAQGDRYDLAYLISNDGDLRPAVELVRSYRKRVFAAGCVIGPRLKEVCNSTIILNVDWLSHCR